MNWAEKIMLALNVAGSVAKMLGVPGATLAEQFLAIAQAANQAHKEATGKDIDPALLGQLPPMPPLPTL